jgi:hypothetical protein
VFEAAAASGHERELQAALEQLFEGRNHAASGNGTVDPSDLLVRFPGVREQPLRPTPIGARAHDSAAENGSDGGGPPASASVGCWCPFGVEAVGDLSEAEAGLACVADPLDNVGRDRLGAAGSLRFAPWLRGVSPLADDAVEFVGGD